MSERILIVDDAAFMRMMLKDILVEAGYQIAGELENGNGIVAKYRESAPDLVTLDIVMPEVDGIMAVKELIAAEPDAKILIVSAMGQNTLVKEAIQNGARGYIVKPFNPNKVVNEVKSILAR